LDTIALVAGDGDGGGEHTEVSSAKAAGEVLHKLASHTSS
jgi:hypothetical protein